jgi:hypothetical protein
LLEAVDGGLLTGVGEGDELLYLVPLRWLQFILKTKKYILSKNARREKEASWVVSDDTSLPFSPI